MATQALEAVAPADARAVALLLGGGLAQTSAPTALAASRFTLTGIVATRNHGGAALIAVDGKPARAYRVGARIDDSLLVQAVTARQVSLGADLLGASSVTLDLPAPSALSASVFSSAAKTSGTPGFASPPQTGNPTQ